MCSSDLTPRRIALDLGSSIETEKRLLEEINEWRIRSLSLPALEMDERTQELARRYSQDMAQRRFFAHVDPDGRTVEDRLAGAGIGFIAAGENLAKVEDGPLIPREVVEEWVRSKSHLKQIQNPFFRMTGIGIWEGEGVHYVTQIFLKPFSKRP